ncbi:MAG: stage II sporulation protein D [Oscillospiraceae bacterium]
MLKYESSRRKTCKKAIKPRAVNLSTVVFCALLLLLLAFLLPLCLVTGPAAAQNPGGTETPPATLPPMNAAVRSDSTREIRVALEGGAVETMKLSEYLFRVVAAEMPASFETEALKAQCVAARTYTLKKCQTGEPKHPDADVCSDIQCCQAYLDPQTARAAWGDKGAEFTEKIGAAVAATDGVVATYGGELISAVFFSSAAGETNDAVAVWGNAVPYLQGVKSPEGAGDVPGYVSDVTVTAAEFRTKFLEKYPSAVLEGEPKSWFGAAKTAENGAVEGLTVGGVAVTGQELRTLCDLRSAQFTVVTAGESITFHVTAYGHGVGMSQYGANVMAKNGAGYEEILKHYYTGVEVG